MFFFLRCQLFECVCVMSNSELRVSGRAVFTVELYLQTERLLIVGAETQETQHDWIQALTKVTRFAYEHAHTHTPPFYRFVVFLLKVENK